MGRRNVSPESFVKLILFDLQNKKLFGRRRLSCISFNPKGAWLQRNLPPQIISLLSYTHYNILLRFRMPVTNVHHLFFCNNYFIGYMITGNAIINIPIQYSKTVNYSVLLIDDNTISYTNLIILHIGSPFSNNFFLVCDCILLYNQFILPL